VQQILWAEIFLKAFVGAALVIAPLTLLSFLGLYRPATGFWPRLVGALSLGLAAGIWLGQLFPDAKGALGPAGLIPINLFAAAALLASLVLGHAAPKRRGKMVVAAATILLFALALLEIAHV
jgi:hypothetical protein